MKSITSNKNELIKTISALKTSSSRKKSKLVCAEGIKLTEEMLKSGFEPIYCFVRDDFDIKNIPSNIKDEIIFKVNHTVMQKLSHLTTPQGILTVAKEKDFSEINANENFILALDTIQDPSNLGAIMRSAEAFGVKTIILSNGCCDCYSSKTVRSSMGSVFRLNIICTDLIPFLCNRKKQGYTIIGTVLDENSKKVDKLYESDKKIIIIGNEGNGISNEVKQICDFGMYIPMYGENESLNAAVAASIIMWENIKQENERK